MVDFFYDKVPLAKIAQTRMWSAFCKAFAKSVIGENTDALDTLEVEIITERKDENSGQWQKL